MRVKKVQQKTTSHVGKARRRGDRMFSLRAPKKSRHEALLFIFEHHEAEEDELTRKTRAENDAQDSSEWTLNKKMHGTKN